MTPPRPTSPPRPSSPPGPTSRAEPSPPIAAGEAGGEPLPGDGALGGLFSVPRPLVGMVHLLPLPGAPGWRGSLAEVLDRAVAEALLLEEGGLDGILVENYGDIPFHPGEVPAGTVAAMAVVVRSVVQAVKLPVGVNVLRNDAGAALAVAGAAGGGFIRVNVHTGAMWTDQGLLQGRAHETLRLRPGLAPGVRILADVLVKHAVPPHGVEAGEAARDQWHRGLADGLIVTGTSTGAPVDEERLRMVKEAVPEAPLWVGSGLGPHNAATILRWADGAIVGSTLHRDGVAGRGIDPERVARLTQGVWRSPGGR